MKAANALIALIVLALGATQLSCNVNDYCLNCGTDDAGGSGDGDANDAMQEIDAMIDAGCVPSGPEVCDGIDNDCNGLKDDNPADVGDQCANQVGACQNSVKICPTTVTMSCNPAANCDPQVSANNCCMRCSNPATPEVCDGVDNNCNSMTDEGDPGGGGKCGTDLGECQAGTLRCQATAGCLTATNCDPLTQNCCIQCDDFIDYRSQTETCNGKDDNCNGLFDEGLTDLGACTWTGATDVGECNIGRLICVGGQPQCGDGLPLDSKDPVFPIFETCNTKDDNCNGSTDEIFNKNIDPLNCGTCGNDCDPTAKTCATGTNARMTCTSDTDCPGALANLGCVVNSQPCCGPICGATTPNGTCSFKCNVGYVNLNNMAADGCEYRCSPTGNEECDGIDNNCNGQIDEGVTPPPGLCLTLGVCAGTLPTCGASDGWECNYPATYENQGEVSCDGLNNDCDGNIDESHPQKHQTCFDNDQGICRDSGILHCNVSDPDGALVCMRGENGLACANNVDDNGDTLVNDGCPIVSQGIGPESGTQCNNNTDDDNDGRDNDGCPQIGNAPESGAACQNNTDDDGDGRDNDGCPNVQEDAETGAQCMGNVDDDGDGAVNDGCPPSTLPNTPAGTENCNGLDDDCNGLTDEPDGSGNLAGQTWVTLPNGVQMMKYEASRPDATSSNVGLGSSIVCSRSAVLPWTNITYPEAAAECTAIGARLCTESEWHHACSVVTAPTPPYGVTNTAATILEAEDYTSIASATVAAAAESACGVNDVVDDDTDGTINDGCPGAGPGNAAETSCSDNADNDNDTFFNDGCPTIAAQTRSWVHDYTLGFSGISAMEALLNTTGGGVTLANAKTQAPRMSYALNVTTAAADYRVWVKIYQTGITNNNDVVHVGVRLTSALPSTTTLNTVTLPAPTNCTMDSECTALTGGQCVDLDANGVKDRCAGWAWVEAPATTYNLTAAAHTLDLYMGDDGVKVDKVAVNNGAAPTDTDLDEGFTWAYESNADVANDTTCNGHERVSTNDDVIPTGTLPMCYANGAGTTDVFDMSGNVKEWTVAQQPGVNPLRGGASNSTTVGTSCPLNFTVADDALQFPNIGFRCCK